MTTQGDETENALEAMAAFDRQELAADECPQAWRAVASGELSVDEACVQTGEDPSSTRAEELASLLSPPDQKVTDAILERLAQTRSAVRSRDVRPMDVRPMDVRPRRWAATAAVAVAFSLAAALVVWFARPAPSSPGRADQRVAGGALASYRLELGGTARMLGADDASPRAYGPGDDFLLRAVPVTNGVVASYATATATPDSSERAEATPLALAVSQASDHVLEFRGSIAELLAPGLWSIEVHLGPAEACASQTDRCVLAQVQILVVR
ncbi:MAG: hypothetical protein JKY37_08070 [Nannocystaceae bacterium]|nr:hypothetical protein [Nannocystaceae bacterium]